MNRILEGLNDAQRAAVQHVDGPLLTLAGPGSGKTRVVTHRIAHLLDQGISPFSIIALTFTNKAAQEMKHRLQRLLGDAPVWMGTFHGYCARFLRHYGRMVGISDNFSIFDTDDSKSAIEQAILNTDVSLTHLKIGDIIKGISNLKNRAITPEMLDGQARSAVDHAIRKVYPAYQKFLLQNNAVDFDDLLMHTATILRTNNELRADLDAKHQYILVDEYQDTNLAQYLIVRGLSLDLPNINVTGDPDQSVYGWRGADIGNILNFERDYPDVQIVRLEQNYRSTPEILSIADSLIACNTRRKQKVLIPTLESGEKVRLASYATARAEADHIADQIASMVLQELAQPKDFAILYRTNAQSRLLEQALMKRRLVYQLIGGFRFYHRQEIRDLLAYLRLVNNPTDDISFRRIVNVPPRGLGEKSLAAVTELARSRDLPMLVALRAAIDRNMLNKKAQSGAKKFLELYDQLVHRSTQSIVGMLNHVLSETDYIEYLAGKKSEAPDESIKGNVMELLSDAKDIDEEHAQGAGLQQFLEQVSLASDTDNLTDDNRVTLMTLHAAKGLEFAHVFVIAVEQDVLPHARSRYDAEQMEEERRLLFVGITRAKKTLQLSNAGQRGFDNNRMASPSPFLMELPRGEMLMLDFTTSNPFRDPFADDDFGDDSFEETWEDFDSSDSSSNASRNAKSARSGARKIPGKTQSSRWKATESGEFIEEPNFIEDVSQEPHAELDGHADHGHSGDAEFIEPQLAEEELQAGIEPTDGKQRSSPGASKREKPSQRLAKARATAWTSPPGDSRNQSVSRLPPNIKTAADLKATVTLAGTPVDDFDDGVRVLHPAYGQGTVLSVDGFGPKRIAKIEFDAGESRSFQLSKSPVSLL
jgi:DNA helicase II / ATP-dependent DNA helicase PcrA